MCKMVTSYSNPTKPHLVSFFSNGKLSCDCFNCKSKHICSHILATAEKLGLLPKFIAWYKKEVKELNLWDLVQSSGVPKRPGDKPQTRKQTRKVKPKVMTTSNFPNRPSAPTPGSSPNSKRQLANKPIGQDNDEHSLQIFNDDSRSINPSFTSSGQLPTNYQMGMFSYDYNPFPPYWYSYMHMVPPIVGPPYLHSSPSFSNTSSSSSTT